MRSVCILNAACAFAVTCVCTSVLFRDWEDLRSAPLWGWVLFVGVIAGLLHHYRPRRSDPQELSFVMQYALWQRLHKIMRREKLAEVAQVFARSLPLYEAISQARECGAEVVLRYPDGDEIIVDLCGSQPCRSDSYPYG